MATVVDAVVLAGGTPGPNDLIYSVTGGKPKALLPIAGKPMVQWVVDALNGSPHVGSLFVVGLPPDTRLTTSRPVHFLPDGPSMLENILNGMRAVQQERQPSAHILLASADIPAITSAMVDWTVTTALQTDHDLYYSVVEKRVMEERYPGSKRSYVRLSDANVCGGDLNMVRLATATENADLWQRLIASRKSALKQAALLGYDLLLLLLLGRVSVAKAERMVSKRLHLKGRVMLSPFAEVAMDVDKPFQYELVRADLERRAAR
ncbi:MAG TPA: NTP transferase domain-containing protein [Anaerolineales bacterium]|nr:NTP transferase domain-containing protein [Anaerolineales bacterium]